MCVYSWVGIGRQVRAPSFFSTKGVAGGFYTNKGSMIDSCYVHTYSYNADLMPAQREQRAPNLLKLKTYELAMTFFFFLVLFFSPFRLF